MNTTTPSTDAWEALHRAHVTITRQLQGLPEFRTVTLREFDVLHVLSNTPADGIRLNRLNESVALTQSSLSRMLERLERRGYVHRWTDPQDLRGLRIRLTDTGRDLHAEITVQHDTHLHEILTDTLTDDELATLTRITTKLNTDHRRQ